MTKNCVQNDLAASWRRRVRIPKLDCLVLACTLITLLTSLAVVSSGADCLSISPSPSSPDGPLSALSSPSEQVFVVKSSSTSQTSNKKSKDSSSFRERFDQLSIQVKENTPIASKLADIQADDGDSHNNARYIYSIVGGPDQHLFSLRKDSQINKVELVNEVNFDFESPKKSYNVLIRAASINLRYEVDVSIMVTDENDNKPQLQDFAIVFNNYKNHFPSAPIGRVPATDADNDLLRFKILAGNNAQLIAINETNGDIQLSPWLNSNVPLKAVIVVAVSDGLNEAVAHMVLTVNLITETMLQNSVMVRLDGIGREEFLTKKYEDFINQMARILGPNTMYGTSNIVLFDVEESIQETSAHDLQSYRPYHATQIVNSTLSVNISFSARADGNDVESYLNSQLIEERLHMNRISLSQSLEVHVAPFSDNLCVQEPCPNYQECQAIYKFERAPKVPYQTPNMIFRPIKIAQSYACKCPPIFTGMRHKTECNLQINQCFSNPCLNGGTCHRHESGYTCECKSGFIGPKCEHSFANSTCSSVASSYSSSFDDKAITLMANTKYLQVQVCGGKSRCVNLNKFSASIPGQLTSTTGGFSCQGCPYPQWSTEQCQLKARSFSKNSYIILPSIRRRHRFHIALKFATVQSDALIFYNGRYNDQHDFIALEIVDSNLKFSYSLGSNVMSVSLPSISVSNGDWHKVAVDYRDRNVTLLIDDCDPIIDQALARLPGLSNKRCSNSTSGDPNSAHRALDLSSPFQMGHIQNGPADYQLTSQGFAGCLSDFYIDHQLVDLYSPIQDAGTQMGCPERRNFCQQHSCNSFPCHDAWGAAKCSCGEEYLGKSCEILISNEKVRRFNGNSYLTFSPIESSISNNWQVSLHFRTINPSGVLMKISLDPEASIVLELLDGGLKLSHKSQYLVYNKTSLDDGEWHFIEINWTTDLTQLQIDYNSNLVAQSSDIGTISGSVIKSVIIGAISTGRVTSGTGSNPYQPSDGTDFSGSSSAPIDDFASAYQYANSSQSFVGCIYGFNLSDNSDSWLSGGEERSVERGCQVADVCETKPCPVNSKCLRKGMNQRKCICKPGYVGERCIPVCELNPCQGENSRCVSMSSDLPFNIDNAASSPVSGVKLDYQCICEPLRSGPNCEHQLSPRCPSNWWGRPVAGSNSSICGPCNCDDSKGFDGDCHKTTGQCFCKSDHYQPAGSDHCLPCNCYTVGSLLDSCNQTTGQCKCRPGVVGRRCDMCTSSWAEVTKRGCEVIYDACPKTFTDNIWWDKTDLDKKAEHSCPESTSTGTASRYCHRTEGWAKAKLFDCISNSFTDLLSQYQFLEENKFPLTTDLAIKIATNLRRSLNETISNPAAQLYGSDMYISIRLIHHLIEYESRQTGLNLTHRQDRLYIRNIVESIDYILDPNYHDNWPEIALRSPDGGAEHLLRLLDKYGKVLIQSQSDTFTQPFEISTNYVTFGLDALSNDQLWDLSKSPSLGAISSPPYATDSLVNNPILNQHTSASDLGRFNYNNDGSSIYLDQIPNRDSSPSIMIPKYGNYAADSSKQDEITKAFIPLKTMRINPTQELISPTFFQAKSRAKRDELVTPDFKLTRQQPALVVYSIYRSIGPLLPSNYDNTVYQRYGGNPVANSPVVWLTVRPANGSDFLSRNIQPRINYMLKIASPIGKARPQCAIWDYTLPPTATTTKNQSNLGAKPYGKFTTKGCEVKGVQHNMKLRFNLDYVNCSCDHLGAVTVLMDNANYEYLVGEESNMKDLALVLALGVSVFILTSAYCVLTCFRGHSIKSNSNTINKNLIFLLLAIELLILYPVISRSNLNQREYQCKLVAIFLHYFSISLFFWLFVNANHFYRMLTELRDINHGPMKFYHVLGYAVPAFFVSVAVGLRMEQFGSNQSCWLSTNDPIIWSMYGPIGLVVVATVVIFSMALTKSLPVNEDPNEVELLKNHMVVNIVKTLVIGIYWFIAVYMVNEAFHSEWTYLFPMVVVLKSLGLFLIICVVDKHVRYNMYVNWLRLRGQKVPLMDSSMHHASSQWIPPIVGSETTLNKHYPYGVMTAGYGGPITTPGFRDSYNDVYQPDVLGLAATSTTSRSTTPETESGVYQRQHRSKDYGRSGRRKHRRRSKKSHHKHHHHKHHHHHHHRSHRHHENDYEHDNYESRRRDHYDVTGQSIGSENNSQLASSHSSDEEDVSIIPKNTASHPQGALNLGNSDSRINLKNQISPASDMDKHRAQTANESQHQTVPMELSAASTSATQLRTDDLGLSKDTEESAQTKT